MGQHLSELNDLVREAHSAQEAFDNWDGGRTYDPGPFGGLRLVPLKRVTHEWDEANIKLVEYIQQHGDEILKEIKKEDDAASS